MKKTILKVIGAVSLASALFFIGCTADINQGNMSADTFIQLGKPEVKAYSYPGLIYYSWKAVPGANAYTLQIINESATLNYESTVNSSNAGYYGYYTPSNNNEKYTIRVSAAGTARSVYTISSDFVETTVTSILPPTGTHALDFYSYEKGAKSGKKGETPKALNVDDIKVVQNDNDVYVEFNGKVYLKYLVSADKDYDELNITQLDDATYGADSKYTSVSMNDSSWGVKIPALSAGTYTINVRARAKCESSYAPKYSYIDDTLTVSEKVTYESFADKSTDNDSGAVAYTESTSRDGSVRLIWNPAKINGVIAPTSYYKVYVKAQNSVELTLLEDEVVDSARFGSATDVKDCYFVDTTVEDTSISYDYYIVLTNDGKFADEYKKVSLAAKSDSLPNVPTDPSGSVSALDADGKANDITWTITLANSNQEIKNVYLLAKSEYFTESGKITLTDFINDGKDITADVDTPDGSTVSTVETKDLDNGIYYIAVVVGETGKLETSKYSSGVAVSVTE